MFKRTIIKVQVINIVAWAAEEWGGAVMGLPILCSATLISHSHLCRHSKHSHPGTCYSSIYIKEDVPQDLKLLQIICMYLCDVQALCPELKSVHFIVNIVSVESSVVSFFYNSTVFTHLTFVFCCCFGVCVFLFKVHPDITGPWHSKRFWGRG